MTRFDLMTRPGHGRGRWRRVATNVTLKEAVALMGDPSHGPKADYWYHELREAIDGELQDVRSGDLVASERPHAEDRSD